MDLAMTENGDLIVGSNLDLLERDGNDEIKDDIIFRIKTYLGDYKLEPLVGTRLEDYIGQPHTRELLDIAENDITTALTRDGFLQKEELNIKGIPVNKTQAMFVIRVTPIDSETFTVTLPFSWTDGFINF